MVEMVVEREDGEPVTRLRKEPTVDSTYHGGEGVKNGERVLIIEKVELTDVSNGLPTHARAHHTLPTVHTTYKPPLVLHTRPLLCLSAP